MVPPPQMQMQRQQQSAVSSVPVTAPMGSFPGQQITVQINNQNLVVVIPPGINGGQQFMVQVPAVAPLQQQQQQPNIVQIAPAPPMLMSVTVPQGVMPGTSLQLQAPDGRTVQVVVPQGMQPGMSFQIQV